MSEPSLHPTSLAIAWSSSVHAPPAMMAMAILGAYRDFSVVLDFPREESAALPLPFLVEMTISAMYLIPYRDWTGHPQRDDGPHGGAEEGSLVNSLLVLEGFKFVEILVPEDHDERDKRYLVSSFRVGNPWIYCTKAILTQGGMIPEWAATRALDMMSSPKFVANLVSASMRARDWLPMVKRHREEAKAYAASRGSGK